MLRLCFFCSLKYRHHRYNCLYGMHILRHRLSAYMSYGTGYRHTCPTAPVIIFIGKLLSFLAKRNPYLHFVFPRVASCIHLVTQSAMAFVSQQDCECFPIEYNTLCLWTDYMSSQEHLGVLAATYAARQRLPLRTSAIQRTYARVALLRWTIV